MPSSLISRHRPDKEGGNHRVVQGQLAVPLGLRRGILRRDLRLQRVVVDSDRALLDVKDTLVARGLHVAAAHHGLRLLDIRRDVVHDHGGEILHGHRALTAPQSEAFGANTLP